MSSLLVTSVTPFVWDPEYLLSEEGSWRLCHVVSSYELIAMMFVWQAQRKMKGVKLQYTESDRIYFDDVAGAPAAKVRPNHLSAPISPFTVPNPLVVASWI